MRTKLNGKTVKIVGNTTSHLFKIGEMVEIINDNGHGNFGQPYNLTAISRTSNLQYTIGSTDFTYKLGKEEIQTEVDALNEEKLKLDSQILFWTNAIVYLKETKSDTFEETEYKAYQVLKTINENTSDIEKAKIIAKIVNN